MEEDFALKAIHLSNNKFTGKERDTESGLDYFGARYYGSMTGRFMSPDWSSNPIAIPFVKISDPQSLNLYAYGRNNPLRYRDVDGHFWQELKNFFGDAQCWCNNAKAATVIQQLRDDLQIWQARFDGKAPDYQHLSSGDARRLHNQFTTAANAFANHTVPGVAMAGFMRFLHGNLDTSNSNIANVRNMSTESIIQSLKPGDNNPNSLQIKADGTVMNGNTRLQVLQERGVETGKLPFDLHESEPVGWEFQNGAKPGDAEPGAEPGPGISPEELGPE